MMKIFCWFLVVILCNCHPAMALVVGYNRTFGGSPPSGISDDFSSDTSANYTAINGGITVAGGVASGTTWANNYLYHSTSVGSANQVVEADLQISGADFSGLICRYNGSNGYLIRFNSATLIRLYTLTGATEGYVGNFTAFSTITDLQFYAVKLECSGSSFHAYIDLNDDNDYGDAGEDLGSLSNSTYTEGNYSGFAIKRSAGNSDIKIDNFTANAL